jgi:NADPH:quinone reductase-like Zn-dependent oxidoreductase
MKAIVYEKYGSPENLELREVDKPVSKDDEVLIKLRATAVNRSDWENLNGWSLARVANFALFKPRHQILGSDIAGVVEAVGSAVTEFQPGDEVFGDILYHMGGFAEYVCAPANILAHKPASLSFEIAASLPQAAVIALQGIRDKGQVQPGQKVLINGAGGGAGTFAVQFAKMYDAEITAVDSADKFDLLRSLGADHFIDYTQEDFTKTGQRYDLVLDVVGYRSAFAYKRALTPTGRYYMAGGSTGSILNVALMGLLIGMFGDQTITILPVNPNTKDLLHIAELVEVGTMTPVIDRCYPLAETAVAMQRLGEGQALGKVIITMA